MKDHNAGRYQDERKRDDREERRRDDRDEKRRESRDDRRKDGRDERHRDDRHNKDGRSRDDKDHRQKRKPRSSSREPKEKKSRRGEDSVKSTGNEQRIEKSAGKCDDIEESGATEKLSLSIEETNKLRAKLGLKPLTTDDSKEKAESSTEKPDVHAPAINLSDVKREEAHREKLQIMKEKRRLEESLFKANPLSQMTEDESAAAWVERTRKEAAKKKLEEARVKAMDELDREFGVGNLVEKEFGNGTKAYKSGDLKGLKIEHNIDSFKEGRDVILTLKDKGILEDGDDVLVNVNIVDDEKALQNIENKKNKPVYNPYDDQEFDDQGNFKEKVVLSKYDDEIRGGPKKDSFVIGNQGETEHDKKPDVVRSNIVNETLKLPELLPVSNYYTQEEMATFKKSSKKMKKNVRKKVKLTADDLLAASNNEEDPPIHNLQTSDAVMAEDQPKLPSVEDIEVGLVKCDDDELLGMDEEVDLSHDREWLEMELNKKVKKEVTSFDNLVMRIKSEPLENNNADLPNNNFYMNSTAEFCRTLGDFMTSSTGPNPFKDEDYEDMEIEQTGNDGSEHQGWQSVEIDEKPVETKVEENHVLDEEPIIDHGLGAALKLASKKGYLDANAARQVNAPKQSNLEAQNYSIEDKRLDDMDDKYSGRRSKYSASGGGPIVEFKEKQGYKPEIKLEYVDEQGREMSKKEAFRTLSHRFHGKGSGKKKLSK